MSPTMIIVRRQTLSEAKRRKADRWATRLREWLRSLSPRDYCTLAHLIDAGEWLIARDWIIDHDGIASYAWMLYCPGGKAPPYSVEECLAG